LNACACSLPSDPRRWRDSKRAPLTHLHWTWTPVERVPDKARLGRMRKRVSTWSSTPTRATTSGSRPAGIAESALAANAAEILAPRAMAGERVALSGGALWIDYGAAGAGRSKLTPALIDKACASPATGRNWNSVVKIGEMIVARNFYRDGAKS